jgi:hypothetical protein
LGDLRLDQGVAVLGGALAAESTGRDAIDQALQTYEESERRCVSLVHLSEKDGSPSVADSVLYMTVGTANMAVSTAGPIDFSKIR